MAQHPEIASRIKKLAQAMRDELGDSLTGQLGTAVRPRATIFDISDTRLLIPRTQKPGVEPDLIRP